MLLQLGVIVSSFDRPRLEKACEAVARQIQGKVEYYNSRIPLSTMLFTPSPGKKSNKKNANHILVTKKGRKVLEVFGTRARASGRLYEDNEKILETLAKYRVYSFDSFKEHHPGIRDMMLFLSVFLIMLGVYPQGAAPPGMLSISMSMFGSVLLSLYC